MQDYTSNSFQTMFDIGTAGSISIQFIAISIPAGGCDLVGQEPVKL